MKASGVPPHLVIAGEVRDMHEYLKTSIAILKQVMDENRAHFDNMPIHERDGVFEDAFIRLAQDIYPEKTLEELDRARIGEMNFTTIYDRITKQRRLA